MVIIGFGATRPEITSSIVRADGPGSLDPTFGIGGKVTTNVNPNEVTNVALQPDGNIVVVAALADFKIASQVFGVLRYLSDGTLDPNFGTGGIVRTAVTTGYNHPYSVAIQPDGKIVVAGSAGIPSNSTDEIAVVRYNSDGTLDQSFGEGGKVTTVLFGFRDVANVVLLQPDGKILIGGLAAECFGNACPHDTMLARYNPDGSLDGTFGSDGSVVVDAIGQVAALALETDGSILALGKDTAQVIRLSADGTQEPVELVGTLAPISATGFSTFQPDGKVVVAGTARGLCKGGLAIKVTRRMLDNALDPAFNSPSFFFGNGICGRPDLPQAVTIESNGQIVVGGIAAMPNFQVAFGVARLLANGSLDATFGNGGRVTTMFNGRADQIDALAVQPDARRNRPDSLRARRRRGKILGVGLIALDSEANGPTAVALTRYLGP